MKALLGQYKASVFIKARPSQTHKTNQHTFNCYVTDSEVSQHTKRNSVNTGIKKVIVASLKYSVKKSFAEHSVMEKMVNPIKPFNCN